MIRYLRKLRQGFLSENRFGKYLIYALGEIVLVVIGILIALAINNANQQRILREKEQVYLQGLQNEFRTSKQKLEELIRVNRENISGATKLLELMSGQNKPVDDQQLSKILFSTFANDIAYNPNVSLLTEMISSGSLKDISDNSLRFELTSWVAILDDIALQENDLRIQREKILDLFRSDPFSLRTIMDQTGITKSELGVPPLESNDSNLAILQSREFENNLLMFILASRQTEVAHYQPLLENINNILYIINED